jgi:hypothetical protein
MRVGQIPVAARIDYLGSFGATRPVALVIVPSGRCEEIDFADFIRV